MSGDTITFPTTAPKAPRKQHGGRRSNSGRKRTRKTEATIALERAVDDAIGEVALDLVANLKRLADGGYRRVVETWEPAASLTREIPAALVMRREPVRDEEGRPRVDPATNEPITVEVPAYPDARPSDLVTVPLFPDAQPGELVVTKRVVEVADGDRAANEYLLNRRFGRPKQALELSGPDGAPIALSMEQAIERIYGEADDAAEVLPD